MITQTFLYYNTFKKDRLWMKIFVLVLFIADTLNSVFDCAWIYQSLILNFGNAPFLSVANWVFGTDPAMTGIISTMVQLFFAWRVRVLTGRLPLALVIAFLSIVSGLSGLGTSIAVGIIPEFVHFQKFQVIVIMWLLTTCICDVAITAALTWHLRRHRTGFPATDDIVNKIIRLTVQTGMITAIVAVIDLGMFLGTSTGLHLSFNFPLSKLYTNSLMSTLNSRAGWGKYSRTTENSEEGVNHISVPRDITMRKSEVVQLAQGRPEVWRSLPFTMVIYAYID
ncbi:hypothetical protein GLOTRDRAFT_129946 [Gloeophyllum trabeum ATCC 11539]|uniref:DUF6534 domain-containing protein n=1 Tax=Gloeophyllum trabeum (strain ATCC 11539 / FP-39264 / Madison 617) TaxID=670483 RepID=S7RJR3_GLOTA|nr:uncharacterized protein GLOTRDRAFT_129946 [Gloeophyllum trabeum ATCC 11539]EPQ54595.1 hypothetical protein GLOTRDRAFT_129946 [Gloeophyllum trabeum ATCC 11539]